MKIFQEGLQYTPWCLYSEYVAACPALLAAGILIGRGIRNAVKNKKIKS